MGRVADLLHPVPLPPVISIVICTSNRRHDLQETLRSVRETHLPDWCDSEVLVVDNASTDGTAQAVDAMALPNLPLRVLTEPRRGKGFAYNRGIAAARGEVLLFTDDDVRVPTDWVTRMCAPLLEGQGDIVVGGVRIAPHLERAWMKPLHRDWLASSEAIDPAAPTRLIGANMAFHRRVLAHVPAFDPELGPGALGFGDESLLFRQCLRAGHRAVAALDVAVEHHFDPSRLLRASLLDAARRRGRVRAYIAYHWEHVELAHPRRDLFWVLRRNLRWRIRRWRQCRTVEGAPDWELRQLAELHFYRHYLSERKRPRRYDPYGLQLLRPDNPVRERIAG